MALGSSTIGEAFIRIRPTATGFEAEVVKEIGPSIKAAEKNLSIKPKADVSKATGPLDVLKGKLQSFGAKSPLASSLKDIETSAGGAGGALSGFATGGIAVAALAITAFAAKGVMEFAKVTAEVRSFQRVVGTSAEDSSRFVAAGKALGLTTDTMTTALGRFTRTLGTNADAVKKQGIEIAKNKDGTVNVKETFLNLADAVSKSTDTTAKNALVMKDFGRGGLALLPILNQGRKGIEDLFGEADKHGQLFSQKDLDAGKEFSRAMRDLKEAITGAFIQAGRVVIPFVTDLAHIGTDITDLTHKFPAFGKVAEAAFIAATGPLVPFVKVIHVLAGTLDGLTGNHKKSGAAAGEAAAAEDALSQASIDAAAKLSAETAAEQDHQKALAGVQTAIDGVITAARSERDGKDSVTQATAALSTANRELSTMLRKGAVDAKAVATAEREVASAARGLVDANRALEDSAQGIEDAHQRQIDAIDAVTAAEQRLDDLRSGRAAATDMVGHEHDLAHAQLSQRSATLAQQAAQKRLTEVQADSTSTTVDLAQAQLDLDDANLRVTESAEAVSKTQDDLNKIQDEGKAGSKTLADAQKDLDDKQRALDSSTRDLMASYLSQQDAADKVTTSTTALQTAQEALHTAQVGDVDFADKLVEARGKVGAAEKTLADARSDLSQKEVDLLNAQEKEKTALEGSKDAAKELLDKYVAMEKQAPATKAALDPLIALLRTGLLTSDLGPVAKDTGNITAGLKKPQEQKITIKPTGDGGWVLDAAFVGGAATGGYRSGSFMTGENGPERVDLLSSGGAYVTPAHRVAASAPGASSSAFTFNINASFGPGSSYDDVMRAMHDVATGVMTESLQRVVAKAAAR